jgi:hypothetical protein
MKPIPEDIDLLPPKEYLDVMVNLRSTILATPEQVSELKESLIYGYIESASKAEDPILHYA